jgi:hypothetical protein
MTVSSIPTDLIFKRKNARRVVSSEPTIEPAKQPGLSNRQQRVSKFKVDKNIIISSNTNLDLGRLGFLNIKDKIISLIR